MAKRDKNRKQQQKSMIIFYDERAKRVRQFFFVKVLQRKMLRGIKTEQKKTIEKNNNDNILLQAVEENFW